MDTVKIETRTTVTSTTCESVINHEYFRTLPGILKLLEVLFGIICVSLASDSIFAVTHFFLFVCWVALILTVGWIVVILFKLIEKFSFSVSWIKLELWYTVVTASFYFLVMILQFNKLSNLRSSTTYVERHTAAAVFALFNTVCYTVGSVLLFLQARG